MATDSNAGNKILFSLSSYSLDESSRQLKLPKVLRELSGMAVCNNALWGIEDEEGVLYRISLESGEVLEEVAWGDAGDYEGLSCIQDAFYILESKGAVNAVKTDEPKRLLRRYDTALRKTCDAEGICPLPGENSLLIACKEAKHNSRELYRLELEDDKQAAEVYKVLEEGEVEEALDTLQNESFAKLREFLHSDKDLLSPSGLAFHPLTGELYVLNGKSRILLVYDPQLKLKEVASVALDELPQPESIAFMPNGDLLIGSEGAGGSAAILFFVYEEK